MGKQRKKMICAGPLVVEAIYPLPNPRDSRQARQGKKNLSSAAQQRMNLKYQWQKLELLLAENFRPGDLVVTLTFDDAHLPDSRSGTMAKAKEFFRNLRQIRKPFRKDTYYIYVIEHNHSRDDPCFTPVELAQQGRYHIHMVLNSTGADYDDIRKSWPFGLMEIHQFIIDHNHTYESLARYFCKEITDKPGDRKFIPSRGLRHPKPECCIVDSAETLTAPRGATVYDNTGVVRTEYGKYQYIKYVWPKLIEHRKPARKRRNKRQPGKRK